MRGVMLQMMLLLVLASYLAGSVPFGLLLGRAVQGIDLRQHGSGNIGATNAGRVLGKKWGLICLALDAMKGLLPVALLPRILFDAADPSLPHLTVLTGVATIVGHMFSCWLGFRGGKGVATSLGVVAMLSPWGMLTAASTFLGSFLIWRIVSLSSMLAAVGFAIHELATLKPTPFSATSWSQGLFAIAVPLLIIIQHRSNLRRLLRGEEPRFSTKRDAPPPEEQQPENPAKI
jgi:acyl phosphate:glycerol-3-phosphate acyltransferase